ncbi:MAG: ABC transporter ATP-binding protein [Candidatus Latescibacteria bacterium]|nr:ABC transporter ATP-binding protein [Candidatus Latescibacterota bacterium]
MPYLARRRGRYALGVLCLLLSNLAATAVPWLVGHIVDVLQRAHAGGAGLPDGFLTRNVLALTGLSLAGGAFMFGMRWLLIGASREIEFELRDDFFAHLLTLDPPYYQRTPVGDLMARAGSDLNAVRMLLGPGIMYTINTATALIMTLALMFVIDGKLTLLGLAPLPVLSVLIYLISSRFHHGFTRIQEQFSRLSTRVQENFSGIRVVKAFGREEGEQRRFEAEGWAYYHANLKLYRMMALFMPTLRLLSGAAIVLILFYGGRAVGEGRITLGQLVTFIQYMIRLSWPMAALGWVTGIIQRGSASWARMLAVLDQEPAIAGPAPSPQDAPLRGDLEIRHLHFAYGEHAVLHDIDLRLPAGETLGIVGLTGSGKTTLLRLIPRLLDPPPGSILLAGRDVTTLPLAQLRASIAWAPQEPLLFSESLDANLRQGDLGIDPALRDAAAKDAGVLDEILGFPKGWDTPIGERGVNLSGGQQQRVSLARALLKDAGLLILDAPFASVDTHTEERILAALRAGTRGRSLILVSHRVSTVRHCQQILVMDGGRIVERGDHASLLVAGGLYSRLHERQLLEDELGAAGATADDGAEREQA